MTKFVKLKPSDTTVDHRYQRDLDQRRMESMAAAFKPELMGVPVLSLRDDGTYVRIDGQHRLAAAVQSGRGDVAVLMEVHDGLDLHEEAELFIRLNGGRTAVVAIDKYRAEIVARVPVALEIQSILKAHGCKITKSPQQGGILAVSAVKAAYFAGNLGVTIATLFGWLDGDPDAFEQTYIKAVSRFFVIFPKADPKHLAKRLGDWSPDKIRTRLKREYQRLAGYPNAAKDAARLVLMDVYNAKTPASKRVSLAPEGPDQTQQSMAS